MEKQEEKRSKPKGLALIFGALLLILAGVIAFVLTRPSPQLPTNEIEKTFGLRHIADIPLAGGLTRFDYQSVDETRGQLYIAHLGSSLLTVFDLKNQKVLTNINDLSQVHGILAVPELGKVFASVTGDNQVAVIDETSFQILARIEAGQYPDGLAYDADDGKIFVSDEFGGTDTVIDVQSNQWIDTIQMGGEVGNTQYDAGSHRIFSAVQSRNQLVAVDPKSDIIVQRVELPGCEHPHGLYIDTAARLAFIACEQNAMLLVLDLNTMQITDKQTVGETPDVLAFDYALLRLYVAAESGGLSIFRESGRGLEKLANGYFAAGAHTVAVDQQTHRVYLPLENVDGQPMLRIMEPLDIYP